MLIDSPARRNGNRRMTTRFSGLWPAMVTPLDASGRVNEEAIERLVELFIRQDLDGLYVVGSTGGWPLLSVAERRTIVERVVRAAQGRLPIMVHVGAATTADAQALARHAAEVGADAVSSVAPIYYPVSADGVFEHYRRIGAASELPLFVYHLQGITPASTSTADYVERLLALPHIAGMKITSGDLFQFALIHAAGGKRLRLFSGADEVMCQAAVCGAVGAIGTFYNVWGAAGRAARQAFVAGDFTAGRRFMLAFQQALGEILHSGGVWSFLRAAMQRKHGIDIGMPRAPLGMLDRPWDAADVQRLLALVDEASPGDAP
jgi:N-acetylneuraminate lyase